MIVNVCTGMAYKKDGFSIPAQMQEVVPGWVYSYLYNFYIIFISHRAGHSSNSENACPHSKSLEWQLWDGDNFVDASNMRSTCDTGRK